MIAAGAAIICLVMFFAIWSSNFFKQNLLQKDVKISNEEQKDKNKKYFSPIGYKRIKTKINNNPQIINILTIDLNRKDVEVKPILAHDQIHGFETTSSMIQRKKGYAGVNGSFFDVYGQPFGLVVVDNKVLASSQHYPVFGIDKNNRGFFKEVSMDIELDLGDRKVKINRLNRLPSKNDITVLTSEFGSTTRMSRRSFNIIIENNIIKRIFWSNRPVDIPKEGLVVVATGIKTRKLQNLKSGQSAKVLITFRPNLDIKNAIECGAWLIRDGKKVVPKYDPWIGYTNTREPRTALGLTPKNKLILITVDGRQPGRSVGFTGDELADYMLKLGVINAGFLDGGGSTAMYLNGKIVNTPSFQGRERSVGNAIGIFVSGFQDNY